MIATSHQILGQEFTTEELVNIVEYGMHSGFPGFTYYHETTKAFDAHDDEIQDYLSDWVHDNTAGGASSFSYFAPDAEDITQLKNKLVWSYVELKAHEELMAIKHPAVY